MDRCLETGELNGLVVWEGQRWGIPTPKNIGTMEDGATEPRVAEAKYFAGSSPVLATSTHRKPKKQRPGRFR